VSFSPQIRRAGHLPAPAEVASVIAAETAQRDLDEAQLRILDCVAAVDLDLASGWAYSRSVTLCRSRCDSIIVHAPCGLRLTSNSTWQDKPIS